jgi:hypothetical protein
VGVAVRFVDGGIRPGDIMILEAVNGFGGRTQTEDAFMTFPLELGALFVPDWFRRKVAGLAELPLVCAEAEERYAWQTPGTYYNFPLL